MLGGCQAEVFHSDGDVDVAMGLAVGTHPFLVMKDGGDDVEGSGVEPVAVVALLQLGPFIGTADKAELPGLTVHGGRCKTHTLQHIIDFLTFYVACLIGAATISVLYQF